MLRPLGATVPAYESFMLHITAGLVDFLMSLMWGGAWALAWIVGGLATGAALIGGAVYGLRSAARRRGGRSRG